MGEVLAVHRTLQRFAHRLFSDPIPFRYLVLRYLDRRLDLLSYADKLRWNIVDRPHYGYCLLQSARLARRLGISRISAIEFGVAGGNGLLAMERHAQRVQQETGIEIAIYGFDSGCGMPPPRDYRDLPYMWEAGDFVMDVDELRKRLQTAQLVLGPVEQTVATFCERHQPPPIGFIAFDLDYYSSTLRALRILEAEHKYLQPRITCYFDDIVGDIDWAYNEFTGEVLAIHEFNATHHDIKVAAVLGLRFCGGKIPSVWHEQVFVAHLFHHPDYGRPISDLHQLPLEQYPAGRDVVRLHPTGRKVV
jgi:hypothetical protein